MAILSLIGIVFLLVVVFHGDPQIARARLSIRVGVWFIYAIPALLPAWGAWTLLRRRRPRAQPGIEPWTLAVGEAFERPAMFVPLLLIFSPLAALVGVGGFVGMFSGLGFLLDLSISLGLTLLGTCGVLLLISVLYFHVLRTGLRVRGSPGAIVGFEGITIPRATPDHVPWSNVGSIRIFAMGQHTFLQIVPIDRALAFPTRRPWWHGPWRDTVDIPIHNRRDPLVEATTQAHAAWLDRQRHVAP